MDRDLHEMQFIQGQGYAGGVSVVAEGNGESSSLGDGVQDRNGNADLPGLDVAATTADTNSACSIDPASTEPLEEARTKAGPSTAFMAINGVAEVGGEARDFMKWKGGWETIGIGARPSFMYTLGC